MEKLIDVVNKLQYSYNAAGSTLLQLPQIVVVGEQSSGKSSVVESIIGRTCLPRGVDIVTRCPIILQLIQKGTDDEEWRRLSDKLNADEWCEFPHLPEGESIETDFNKIPHIINNEVTRRAGDENCILKEELVVRIISPNVINLTLVDLPGLVYIPDKGWPDDTAKQIADMVTKYISNPNSIILAVSAASTDISNSKSIDFVKSVDPNYQRTIAVLTKLDLMDKGTDALKVLTGQALNVKLGIIGVVNRSFNDNKGGVSIKQSIENEAIFLLDNYPTIASQNGIPFLKIRLQTLLMSHIKKKLPPLQTRLTNMQIKAQKKLDDMGSEVPANKSLTMLEIIEDFCNGFKSSIVGKNRHIQKNVLTGGAQINVAFEEELARSLENIVPDIDIQNEEILTKISNSRGIESSVLITEAAYQDLVRDQIERLETPALRCASAVHTEMMNIMQMWAASLELKTQCFPDLNIAIISEVTELLNERHLEVQKLLKSYIVIQSSFIKTIQMDFNTEMHELVKKNPLSKNELNTEGDGQLSKIQDTQCTIVRQLVHNYFQIVKTAFQDYCPKVIAHTVIYFMEKHIYSRLMGKLYKPEKVDQLVQESVFATRQREVAKTELKALNAALEVIRETRDTHL